MGKDSSLTKTCSKRWLNGDSANLREMKRVWGQLTDRQRLKLLKWMAAKQQPGQSQPEKPIP